MELNNEFEVDRGIEQTWEILTDVERIAPCLPGAQLQEIDGEEYKGIVKVKVGPITAQYKGKAVFKELDKSAYRCVIDGAGRDSRGQGNASALITLQLSELSPTRTKATVNTDLTVTGKVAQFGRGVMGDISEKLLLQFVDNLEALLEEDASTSADTSAAAPAAAAGAVAAGAATATATSEATSTATPTSDTSSADNGQADSGPRKIINQEPVEPVDLLDATGAPIIKRAAPALGVMAVLMVIYRMLRNRA